MASTDILKDQLQEIQSARDDIKSTLNANGVNVGNDIRTFSAGVEAVASVKKVNNISADENKNVTIDASNINVDEKATTKQTIKSKLESIDTAIENIAEYSIAESTTTSGYAKTYSLTKDGTEVGAKINIPKDLVVNKGEVKTVTTANTPYTGAAKGDKYIDLTLNDNTKDHIYIPVKDLVDVYTGKNGSKINVTISDGNEIEATIKSGTIELTDLVSTLQTKINKIPTTGNIATEDYVDTAVDGIEIPEVTVYEAGSGITFTQNDNQDSADYGNITVSSNNSNLVNGTGNNSAMLGSSTEASGINSFAIGASSKATSSNAFAEGMGTIARGNAQHVQGKYNKEDEGSTRTKNTYAHIVGNGTSNTERSNAHTIDWDGNGWFSGNVKVGGTSQDDTNSKTLATEEYADNTISRYFADPTEVELTESHTGTYYFVKSNGIYKSNSQGIASSTAESKFTVPAVLANTNFQVKWTVSSESNWDKFTIKVGDDTKVSAVSGTKSGSFICSVASGTVITATYTKDSGGDTGDDCGTIQFLTVSNKDWLSTVDNPSEVYEPLYDGSPATKKYVDTKFGSITVPESFDGEVFGGWHMYSDGADLTNEAGFTEAMYEKIKVGNILYYPSSVSSNESVETIITYVSSGYSYKSAGGRFWYKRFSTGAGYTYEVSDDALFSGHIYKGTSADDGGYGGGGVACFTADTLISTPTELKKISDIKVGDKVYSYNDKKKVIEEKKVDKLVNHLTDTIYKITVGNNEVIETTYSHPFFVLEKGKCIAENLEVGDTLRTLDNRLIQITNIEIIEQKDTTVYEIRVKGNNNYYVGEQNSVLVYNEKSVIEDK